MQSGNKKDSELLYEAYSQIYKENLAPKHGDHVKDDIMDTAGLEASLKKNGFKFSSKTEPYGPYGPNKKDAAGMWTKAIGKGKSQMIIYPTKKGYVIILPLVDKFDARLDYKNRVKHPDEFKPVLLKPGDDYIAEFIKVYREWLKLVKKYE